MLMEGWSTIGGQDEVLREMVVRCRREGRVQGLREGLGSRGLARVGSGEGLRKGGVMS